MEEYLKILSEQIRYKKALPAIEDEIRVHLQEQAEVNRSLGMDEEKAMQLAVKDMGDPVETGVKLDRIHRPQMAWDMIALMAIVAVISIVIHIAIGLGAEEIAHKAQKDYILSATSRIGIGFLGMLLVYRLDYSILAGKEKLAALLFLTAFTINILFTGITINGRSGYGKIGPVLLSPVYLLFLYAPLYGAVLYRYRGTGFKGLGAVLLFLFYPVWLACKIPSISLAGSLLLILSVMFSAAVWKGWFAVPKKIALGIYWGLLAIAPLGLAALLINGVRLSFLPVYQQDRILSFMRNDSASNSYVGKTILDNLKNCRLFGAGNDTAGILPDYYNDYILTFLSSYYGLAAAITLCLLLCLVAAKAFRIAFSQKNQLGLMMGFGSGLTLFVNMLLNIGENFGLFPATATFLPFFSYTGTGIAVSYLLAGIILSVYRYKNLNIEYFTVSKIDVSVN